ncbi:hypothetical protein JOC33_000584 [Thalassobacillus pellis]|nr:hypothetical protein [Thalassobacillus pellis]
MVFSYIKRRFLHCSIVNLIRETMTLLQERETCRLPRGQRIVSQPHFSGINNTEKAAPIILLKTHGTALFFSSESMSERLYPCGKQIRENQQISDSVIDLTEKID